MIGLLISLLILCIVIYVVKLVMDMLPLPDPIKMIAYLILGLIGLLILLNMFGVGAGASMTAWHWRGWGCP